jgi:AcrR family transcriptional regulator
VNSQGPTTVERPPDRRSTRWEAHRRARRGALVQAAIEAVREHGAGVGMDEIAAVAGTSKTVVYRYFTDRSDLYLAVCTRVADRLVGQLTAALDGTSDPRQLLARAVDAYLRVIEADPDVYRFVVHRPLTDRPVSDDPIAGLSALVGEHVAGLVGERLTAAGLDATAARPWGHGLVGLVRSAADHWLDQREPMGRDQLAGYLTDLIWTGLAGVLAATGMTVDTAPPRFATPTPGINPTDVRKERG